MSDPDHDRPTSNDVTRRGFIGASIGTPLAGGLAGGLATAGITAGANAGAAQPEGEDERGDAPAITTETVAAAAALLGIEFDEAERELMLRTLTRRARALAGRRTRVQPNELAPAETFDPRPPGFTFPVDGSRVEVPPFDPGPVPDDETAIAYAPLERLAHWVRRRDLTSERLTRIYIDRIKRLDPKLRAVVTLTDDLALDQARRADAEIAAGRWRGPLHGMPYGAKDLLDTAGIRTSWGATPYKDRVPEADAVVVERLREAGAALLAKTTLGALAYGDIWFDGRTNNPWNLEQGSSGSSAGSASGTAAGLFAFSIGTETYGSIISPSMRCGTTGLRPTFGRVPRTGAMALCWSLDKIGPITRTVQDAAWVLGAINGADAGDPSSIDAPYAYDGERRLRGARIGVDPRWFEGRGATELDREALAALKAVAPDIGAEVVEVEGPDPSGAGELLTILEVEAATAFADLTISNRDDELVWQEPQAWPNTFRAAWFHSAIDLVQAQRARRGFMERLARTFDEVDVLFAPSFAGGLVLMTNFTGHPSLTLRVGVTDEGLPRGMTFFGRLFDEGTLCRVGRGLEQRLGVWDARPTALEAE